jgi:hypothetical protein
MQVDRLLLTGLACALAACAPGHALEGSLTPLLDLHHERVEAQRSEDGREVSVRFLRARGAGEDTVLKVAVNLEGHEPQPRQPIDLSQRVGGESGPQRGSVSRDVLDEPARGFPALARGGLTFHGPLEPGRRVSGELHLTFTPGTDVYSGRTLFGRFEASVP